MIKQFCDVVETGSFTRAAEMNGVTQSAVSQSISNLERMLGAGLLSRSKKRSGLTYEGTAIWDEVKKLLQTYEEMNRAVEKVKTTLGGRVEVATTESIGLHELPEYVKIFMSAYAGTDVRVGYGRTQEVYDHVLGNDVDLGVVSDPPALKGKLGVIPFRHERLALICNPQNALVKAGRIGLDGLAGQKFVGYEPDGRRLRVVEAVFDGKKVNQIMAFDNVDTVKRAVEVGAGVAIVPEDTVRQEVASGVLARVALQELDRKACCHVLALIHRKQKVLSPAAEQFIKVLKGAECGLKVES